MITGKDNVAKWLRFNNTPFWRVKRSEKGEIIFDSGEMPLTIDESVSRFENFFNNIGISSGTYFVEAWETQDQKKGWYKDTIQILPSTEAISGFIQQQSQPPSQIDITAEIAKALEEYKLKERMALQEKELAELRKENRELKKDGDSAIGRIFTRVEPYFDGIMKSMNIAPAAKSVAAVGSVNEASDISVDQAQIRLEKAFELWGQNETDVVLIVEKIAAMSANDKGMYSMARGMLIN